MLSIWQQQSWIAGTKLYVPQSKKKKKKKKSCLALHRGNLCCKFTWTTTPVHAKLLQSCLTLRDPMDCMLPGSSVMGLSRQEYWSGLPWPPLGDLSNPGTEFVSLSLLHWQMGSLRLAPLGKPEKGCYGCMDWTSSPGLLPLLAGRILQLSHPHTVSTRYFSFSICKM